MPTTADSFASLSRRLNRIFYNLKLEIPGFCGYTRDAVGSRLMQRFTELSVFEFSRLAAEEYTNSGSLPADDVIVRCPDLTIEGDRKIRLSNWKFITLLFEFLICWAFASLAMLLSLRLFRPNRKISLLYGIGKQELLVEGSDERFANFCRNGHISPLTTAECLVVQSAEPIYSSDRQRIRYGLFPLWVALGWKGLSTKELFNAVMIHVVAAFSYLKAVYLYPNLILLGRDVASHASAVALNNQGCLIDVVLTNSNYFSQPLWMWALPGRRFSCHMVWYSQNNYPISYVDEGFAAPIPNLNFIKVDVQWVWTSNFKQFLQQNCPPCNYKIVPPVVWYLPSVKTGLANASPRIILFDVTPISYAAELKLGLLRNYYNEKNMSGFICDVIDVAKDFAIESGITIEVVLKHKREHTSMHSLEYIERIAGFINSRDIRLAEPASNLYDLIQESNLVIAVPFSSPVYICKEVGKVAVWYDSTSSVAELEGDLEVPLIKGRGSLLKKMREVFSNQSIL